MSVNRGKQFEDIIREQFKKLKNVVTIRLYDVTTGYINQNNICDLIVYKKPNMIFLECKTTNSSTLNFKSQIRENQLNGLLDKSKIDGIIAGILCWFIQYDKTIFLPIQYIDELMKKNKKSFNINNYHEDKVIEIEGDKKRIFFNYNLEKFLNNIII